MDAYERSKLGDAVKEESFSNGDYIIRQGATGDKFFMISEGTAIATLLQKDGT
jgi:CRP-like cAMP-binding protein